MGAASIRRGEERFRGADGASLLSRSWSAGPANRSLVLVHGFGEHSGRYDEMACWFAARGFDVHAYDQRGHGASAGPRGHADGVEALLDDLEVFLHRVDQGSAAGTLRVLVGHSMGGLVVSALAALRHPDIDLLVTSGALLELSSDLSALKIAAARLLRRIAPRLAMDAGLDHAGLSTDPEVIRRYEADPLVHGRMSTALAAGIMDTVPAVHSAAGEVCMPMLMLHGEDDPLCPPAGSRKLFERLPKETVTGSELHTYPRLRHEIFNEPCREAIFQDVLSFVEKRESER